MAISSITRSAARSTIRIVALPLTPKSKVTEHLTSYHFIAPPDDKNAKSWSNIAVAKASDLWARLGKAPEGSWKRRAFLYGERLVDRVDFEELALKSLDPSLGPKLSKFAPNGSKEEIASMIPLIYPPSACASPIPHLRSLLAKRTPRHRRGFWFWVAVTPLTVPLKLIPIIPNFPFFFCVWRAWSHYRAYKASQYLEGFLQQGAIVPQESDTLDAIYARYRPPQGTAAPQSEKPPPLSDRGRPLNDVNVPLGTRLLLTKEAVEELRGALEFPENSTFAADVLRALEQARLRLDSAKK